MRLAPRRLLCCALVCGVAVLATGCASSRSHTADPATVATTGRADGIAAALQFQAPILGGGELDGASLAGRPVLMWFWAPT
ncbi:MAG: hypothetical protein AB7L17_17390 [Ilumatobacteraceae bacterium]